jgi:hypothetical protein
MTQHAKVLAADSRADAWAALSLIAITVATAILWVSQH